jgi:hypothetical protein
MSNSIKIFSETEATAIRKKWMEAFCKNKQGANTKQFLWHIFSGGRYPSDSGDLAKLKYEQHIAPEYVVMPNEQTPTILTSEKPSKGTSPDCYIFPTNMAWTMAFTHEEGWLGPYFALHPNYEALNRANEEYRKKLHQMTIAKQKGWYKE